MLSAVYKSLKMEGAYLFVEKRNDFSRVPELLMEKFGQPVLAMMLPLDTSKKLAMADINKVKQELSEKGFYLQLPPPRENLLEQHKLRKIGLTKGPADQEQK